MVSQPIRLILVDWFVFHFIFLGCLPFLFEVVILVFQQQKMRSSTENQLPRLPGIALKVPGWWWVVASYPLSSQAPTHVEVELGCGNILQESNKYQQSAFTAHAVFLLKALCHVRVLFHYITAICCHITTIFHNITLLFQILHYISSLFWFI